MDLRRITIVHMDTEVIPIRLPKAIAARAREKAEAKGLPFSTYLRMLLSTHPDLVEDKKGKKK